MMISKRELKSLFTGLARDKRGNFGVATAVLLPVLLASGGVAMDLTRMVQVKSELQNAADSAALAAASAMAGKGMTDSEATELAKKFLASQMANLANAASLSDEEKQEMLAALEDGASVQTKTTTSSGTKNFDVTVEAKYDLPLNAMTQLLGFKTASLAATSTAKSSQETQGALSMHLVLDKSGSMAWATTTVNTAKSKCSNYNESNWGKTVKATSPCYLTKIEALQAANSSLMAQLETADPDHKYVRTAAVSYNTSAQTASSLAWGTSATLTYVNALVAEGGTASTAAFKAAYNALIAAKEDAAHLAKNGQVPDKFIVLMTDGDNNSTSDDTATKSWCDTAKANGITVFTVAFVAPSRGKALLSYCASSSDDYYDAQNAEQLVAAFAKIGEKASQDGNRLTN